MAMVTTMLGRYDRFRMAKAGLLEQNRLSGANRNTPIAEELWQTLLRYSIFRVPDAAQRSRRVARSR